MCMKALMLYRPNSEDSRRVEEYIHDFRRTQRKDIDLINLNTREGVATASMYDIVRNPSLLILRDDGQLVKFWQDEQFPLMNELASYLIA